MPAPTVVVSVNVSDQNGVALEGATIVAKLIGTDVYNNELVAKIDQEATTDANGLAELDLFPNAIGSKNTYYRITVTHPTTGRKITDVTCVVPNAACNLTQIANNLSRDLSQAENPQAQPESDLLTSLASVVSAADKLPYLNGVNSFALTDFTAMGRSLVGAATAAAAIALFSATSPTFAGVTLTNASELNWKDAAGASQNVLFMFSDDDVYLSAPVADSNLIFRAAGFAEAARITAARNVLIGTATDDGVNKLQVAGSALLGASGNGGQISYGGSVTTWKSVVGAGYASAIYDATQHIYHAGGVDKGRWSTNGHLLIGRSTDDGVSKLQVVDAQKISRTLTDADWSPLTLANEGSWAAAVDRGVFIDVTDGAGIIGKFGIRWDGAGKFVVSGLYSSAAYGATGDVFVVTPTGVTLGNAVGDVHTVNGALVSVVTAGSAAVVLTSATGDRMRLFPQAAGSGGVVQIVNAAASDYEPLSLDAEYVSIQARTGAGTVAEVARVTSTGLGVFCTPSYALHVAKEVAGSAITARLQNSDNTNAASDARLEVWNGGASGGDALIAFGVNAVTAWAVGVDNSDSDKFKISANGSGVLGTSDYLTIDTSGNVSLSASATLSALILESTGTSELHIASTGANLIRFWSEGQGGAEQFRIAPVGSSVNMLQVQGAAAASGPAMLAVGADTNIGLVISSKGGGAVEIRTNSASQSQFLVAHTASAVNYVQVTGGATGNAAVVSAQGSDTNIQLTLFAKGTQGVALTTGGGTQALVTDTAGATRYLTLTGSNGGNPTIGASAGNLRISTSLLLDAANQGVISFKNTANTSGFDIGLLNGDADFNGYVWQRAAAALLFGTSDAERARVTASGYFKASNAGTYQGATGNYHELRNGNNGDYIAYLAHSHASNPGGVVIAFTGAAPNGTGNQFLTCSDTGATRAEIRSNGGIANFSANDVNLSDLSVKPAFELYADAGLMPKLWEAHKAMRGAWGRFQYDDQTHGDWNHGYGAQLVAEAFADVAPELVDEWQPGSERGLLAVYQEDLHNITGAVVTEMQYRVDDHESRIRALEAAQPTIH